MSDPKAVPVVLADNLTSKETIEALDATVSMLKQEYGEMQLTAQMRKQLAEEMGEAPETVDNWQKISDVLDHIDIAVLAKKHPEAIGKVTKGIVSVVGFFYPAVGAANNVIPGEFAAKLVEFAGILTPEHLANMLVKSRIKKNKEKQDRAALEGETQKTAKQGLSGLFAKKKKEEPQEDVFETIKKLAELKDMGIISQEEFDAKKAELLAKI